MVESVVKVNKIGRTLGFFQILKHILNPWTVSGKKTWHSKIYGSFYLDYLVSCPSAFLSKHLGTHRPNQKRDWSDHVWMPKIFIFSKQKSVKL